MPLSGTLSKAQIIDAVAERNIFTRKKSIEILLDNRYLNHYMLYTGRFGIFGKSDMNSSILETIGAVILFIIGFYIGS